MSGSGTVATGTGTERTLLVASTGTTTGSTATAESARRINYKAGLGIKVAFTARLTTPAANTTQIAGLFDACDGIGIGCNGAAVGLLYRAFGQREIRKLTVTTAATGAETATVTLNGQSRTVALTSGTKLQTANTIAAASFAAVGSGWDAWVLQPAVGDPEVWFLARAAASQPGSYSLSSTGAAAGTFSQVTGGAAPPTETWIPQVDWSVDRCDGSSTPTTPNDRNPSGISIDVTRLQVVKLQLQYLGAGSMIVSLENPENGQFTPIHIFERANANTTATFGNMSLPVCLYADNGSTTSDIKVATASMYAATEGTRLLVGPAVAVSGSAGSIGATDRPILTIRNDREYNGQPNHNPLILPNISLVNVGGAVAAVWKLIRGGTLQNTASFGRASSTMPMSVDTTATTITGGEVVGIIPQPTTQNTPIAFDYASTDAARLFPGETLTLTCSIGTGTTTATASVFSRWDV